MPITLRIDNFDQLPDGGPVEFTAGARGFDIGRETHLDWTLPDPSRVISAHHCQVRYEGGEYWLHDVSRNGTFVNGAPGRVKSPYRLMHGDRLQIGPYYISVSTMPAGQVEAPMSYEQYGMPANAGGDLWSTEAAAPQPVDRRWFAGEQRRARAPDVLDQYVELPRSRQSSYPPIGGGYGGSPLGNMPGSQIPEQPPAYPAPPLQPRMPMPGAPVGPAAVPGAGAAAQQISAGQFLNTLAVAAGVSPQAFAGRNPDEIAGELGTILRTVTEQLTGLLLARAAAKLMAKSSNRTMIGSDNNNPLKFIPDASEAIAVMFQRNRPGYLGAAASFKEGFDNIKSHELATYAAMQKALARLMEDLTPEKIEDKVGGSAFGSKKAKAWELYVERWNAKTEHYENGILDVFLAYFADAYDAAAKDQRSR